MPVGWAKRSDIKPKDVVPVLFDREKKAIADALIEKLAWCTNTPVSSAVLRWDEDDESYHERPLTEEELCLPYFPFDRSTGDYILIQPNAALQLQTADSLPTARRVRNGASIMEVLEHVYNMTVREGKFAIADRIYFERFDRIKDRHYNMLMVVTGS